jgi:hypothetical protein
MAALPIMDLPHLLAEFCSRDVSRIRGACAAVRASWDREALSNLATHIPEIKAATEGIEWGGLLMSNSEHLQHAMRRMEYARDNARDNAGCFCRVCDLFDNPTQLQENGHMTIQEFHLEQRMYEVSCNECGTAFEVEQREYHYSWWQWKEKAQG